MSSAQQGPGRGSDITTGRASQSHHVQLQSHMEDTLGTLVYDCHYIKRSVSSGLFQVHMQTGDIQECIGIGNGCLHMERKPVESLLLPLRLDREQPP